MGAYQACTGWDEILGYIKSHVGCLQGNKEKTIEYYEKADRKAAIKRIKRIVNQERKRAQVSEPNQSTSMHSTIKKEMRYAKKATPEERREKKFTYVSNLSSSTEDEIGFSEELAEATNSKPEDGSPSTPHAAHSSDSNVEGKEKEPKRPDKKRRRKRRAGERGAYEAHTQMCQKAMTMMGKIDALITKLDSDSD